MLPSSSGAMSDESGSEEEDAPPLNLHINQHSNLYKYNNQFTIAKKAHKRGNPVAPPAPGHPSAVHHGQRHSMSDEGEDEDDRPDSPIQVA